MTPRQFDASNMTDENGININATEFVNWPDDNAPNHTIRVTNDVGDTIESVDMPVSEGGFGVDAARWKELRDMMPDDTLYFQPKGAGDRNKTTAAKIRSFHVYRNWDNAKKAHPDCDILSFAAADIGQPVFLDCESPTLYWNKVDD